MTLTLQRIDSKNATEVGFSLTHKITNEVISILWNYGNSNEQKSLHNFS